MKHQRSIWTALLLAFAVSALSVPAHAQNVVSWVSGTGSGAACTRAASCATLGVGIAHTVINGEIRCLDAGDFGPVVVAQSVTIDCHEAPAVVRSNLGCFLIQLSTSLASDPAQTVKIRGVTCDGQGAQSTYGVQILSAAAVYLEDMVIT